MQHKSSRDSPRGGGASGGKEAAPFLKSLRQMLEVESEAVLRWTADGCAFEIHDMHEMMARVLPKYFKHCKYTSFQRQLNYFSFRKWTKSKAVVCTFSNDFFLRDRPELACRITRKKSLHSSHLPKPRPTLSRAPAMAQPTYWRKACGVSLPTSHGVNATSSQLVPHGGMNMPRLPFPSPTDTEIMLKEHDQHSLQALLTARRHHSSSSNSNNGNVGMGGALLPMGSYNYNYSYNFPAGSQDHPHVDGAHTEPLDWIDCFLPSTDRVEDDMYACMYPPAVPVTSFALMPGVVAAANSASGATGFVPGGLGPAGERKVFDFVPTTM